MRNQHRAGVFVAALLVASSVSGHTVINEGEAVAGELTFITLRVTHGCGTSPTTSFRVQIPDGVTRVTVRYLSDWKITKTMRKLDTPFKNEDGTMVTETISEVTWSGGSLPDGYYGEFQLRAMMPKEPGKMLYFKSIQGCAKGEIRWIEVAKPGDPPMSVKEPAPFIKLIAPSARKGA